MAKKHIESYVNEVVDVEPDFQKITYRIDYVQFEKKNNKIRIFKLASILSTVSIVLVLTFLIIIINLDINNSQTQQSTSGGISLISPTDQASPIYYRISTDFLEYEYNQEVKIKIEVGVTFESYYEISQCDLYIKIKESEYYDIVGKSEYVIEDYNSPEYLSMTEDTQYFSELTFIIKPVKESYSINTVGFSLKFEFADICYEEKYSRYNNSDADWWVDFSDEYFLNLRGIYFINGSGIMKLSTNLFELLNNTLMKEYNDGLIDKSTYMDKYLCSLIRNRIGVHEWLGVVEYYSENLVFYLRFKNQDAELNLLIRKLIEENKMKDAAELILNTAYEFGDIPQKIYEIELANIQKLQVGPGWRVTPDLIPFRDYEEFVYDYEYIIN